MSQAPALPDQTPIVLVKAGMVVVFDAACQSALAKCGVDPENFGSYTARANAEKAARDTMGSSYRGQAALAKHGPETWLEGNSQSGHVMQNAFAQGKRDDPCSNVPPRAGDGGGYGYDMRRALCMDHFGGSTVAGTPHYEITQGEAAFARGLQPGQRVGMDTMEQSVRGTAAIAVAGSQARLDQPNVGDLTPERLAQAQRFQQAQQAQAAALSTKPADLSGPGTVGTAAGARAGEPGAAGAASGLNEDQQKAVDCIVAAWKASLDQIRKDAIAQNSTAGAAQQQELAAHNAANPPGVQRYEDIPQPHRGQADARVAAAVEQRQAELRGLGAHDRGTAANPPTRDDCREYQANWLWQQQQQNGALPPMAGRVPGERQGGQQTADGASGEQM